MDGELELAADAVGCGDEDGVGKAFGIESEEAGEATYLAEDLLIERAAGEALDAVIRENVAIRGDDGVIVVARSAGFFMWRRFAECRRSSRAFTRRLVLVAGV